MRWKSTLAACAGVACAGVLVGGGALPPADCDTTPPASHGVAATLEPAGGSTMSGPLARSIGPASLAPSLAPSLVPSSIGAATRACGGATEAVGLTSGSLRNETADALHGLQPAEGLHSPLDDPRIGVR